MRTVVLVKGVPDFREGKVKFKEDNTLDRGSTPTVLNPNDQIALEAALETKVKHGGETHLVTMGPPNYKVILQQALEITGERTYLCSDIKLGGADTLATAETLSAAIRKIGNVDLVFFGFKSADGETGQTGPQTAWKLGWPVITHVTRLEVFPEEGRVIAERFVYDEVEEVEAPLPCVIVTDPGFQPTYRQATHRLALGDERVAAPLRAKEIEQRFEAWNAAALAVDEGKVGLRGSPTIVRMVEPIPAAPKERTAKVFDGAKDEDLQELAKIIKQKVVV
ncbi:MAG: electron transfer flavoprotein subunit beta/FixA family protein [Thermoplasmatota archaeon]